MPNPNIVVPEQNWRNENIILDQAGDGHHFGPLPGTRQRFLSPEEVLRQEIAEAAQASGSMAVAATLETAGIS